MLKRVVITFVLFLAALVGGAGTGLLQGHAGALTAPAVVRTYVTVGSWRYTVTATDSATFTADGRDVNEAVITTGGCKNVYRKVRARSYYQSTTCATPGTVAYTTPLMFPCDQLFSIAADGATFYSDLPSSPCPPPPPPAVTVVQPDASTIVLTNPADVAQQKTVQFGVAAADSSIQADADVTYWVQTQIAASGPNHYVYFEGYVQVTLDPGQVVTIVIAPGSPELIGDTLYVCQGVTVTKPFHHCLGTWVPAVPA